MDIADIVHHLREQGSDDEGIEAKAAHEGFPSGMPEIVCAMANHPQGGYIVFGLDERSAFKPVTVYDLAHCRQSIANIGRASLEPPVEILTELVDFQGYRLVLAQVKEADKTVKPVVVKKTGQAYLRHYDGTYPLSQVEVQTLITARYQQHFDRESVPGTEIAKHLDRELIARYIHARRNSSRRLTSASEEEILIKTGVANEDGTLTLAGLLALGDYPQQFFPTYAIQGTIPPDANDPVGTRSKDLRVFDGPIPAMVEACVDWVTAENPRAVVVNDQGVGKNHSTYPRIAVRELVANSIIHRDLSPFTRGELVNVTLRPDQLVITNPGGLFGLSVNSLGKTASHTRNNLLAEILTHVPMGEGHRVIERLGSGIPMTQTVLEKSQMQPALFQDSGLRFTARVLAEKLRDLPEIFETKRLSERAQDVYDLIRENPLTRLEISHQLRITSRQARYVLDQLREKGVIVMEGEPSERDTRYRLASH